MLHIDQLTTAALSVIEDATSYWVGLFETVPDEDLDNFVELSATGYARVEVTSWLTKIVSNDDERVVVRYNAGEVVFPEVTEDGTVYGLGIFDASSGGNLLYWAPFTDSINVPTGSEVNFQEGVVQVGFGDAVHTKLETFTVKIEAEGVTTDATATDIATLLTLSDEEAVTVEARITGQATGGKHYYRRVEESYHRYDGGPGSEVWTPRFATVEGDLTREGFTTATATVSLDGDEVKVRVKGEAGTTVNWKITAEVRYG